MIILIGYIATILTASTMMPQIFRSIHTKSVEDISFIMLVMYIANAGLWTVYGILIDAKPLIIADSLACCAGITQLVIKLKYYKYSQVKNF
jgi:MtN3 and saliva related transmembrane protein